MQTIKTLAEGQLVIPAEIRLRFGIVPGALVEIREADDHLEIYPLPHDPIAAFRGSLKADISMGDALIEEHRQDRESHADI
jgi:AbrB family looped-hinge helix DNA binding protein